MSPSIDHDEQMPNVEYRTAEPKFPSWLPMLIWSVVAFLVGAVFSAGMGWGKNDSTLQSLNTQLAEIKGQLGVLTEKYIASDKSGAQKLQELDDHFSRVEDHLTHDDERLDAIEGLRLFRRK